MLKSFVNKITKIDELKSLYKDNYEELKKTKNFWQKTLDYFNISYSAKDIDNIPKIGPTIVVANHPFGLMDGLIISSIVSNIRSDYKILINEEISQIDLIKEYLLPIKFSEITSDIKKNVLSKKNAIKHVNDGGILITFPSGEVATSKYIFDDIKERNWKPLIGSIIKKTNCEIIPVRFFGKNSITFQTIGFINNNLRRAFFIRELFNKKGKIFNLSIGNSIQSKSLNDLNNLQISNKLKKIVLNLTY
jgi:putative hemolysin